MNDLTKAQNFLSVDKQTARNSYGEFYSVGELVAHDDETAGNATILSFEADATRNEVRVNTNHGYAYVDFLVRVAAES